MLKFYQHVLKKGIRQMVPPSKAFSLPFQDYSTKPSKCYIGDTRDFVTKKPIRKKGSKNSAYSTFLPRKSQRTNIVCEKCAINDNKMKALSTAAGKNLYMHKYIWAILPTFCDTKQHLAFRRTF